MVDKERDRRWEKRFFFRSPKQEDRYLIFNLSKKGASYVSAEAVELGQQISFDITLPQGLADLKLAGKVRWVKKVGQDKEALYLTGIQFEEQDETTIRILEAYLQYLQRDRMIQKARSDAIENLNKFNRLLTSALFKKLGLPDYFH
jgi:Tfp pilus assembly protein PilZ